MIEVREQRLVDAEKVRELQILTNSGVSWKSEYAEEMQRIDARIAELLPLVEAERKKMS